MDAGFFQNLRRKAFVNPSYDDDSRQFGLLAEMNFRIFYFLPFTFYLLLFTFLIPFTKPPALEKADELAVRVDDAERADAVFAHQDFRFRERRFRFDKIFGRDCPHDVADFRLLPIFARLRILRRRAGIRLVVCIAARADSEQFDYPARERPPSPNA